MKIREAISIIKSDNKAFSDDTTLTNRFIWSKINSKTLLFLKQRNDKFNLNNNNFLYSILDCVEMELVNSINCCKEIPSCKILRSKKKLPKISESNLSSIIKGIYTLDSSEKIDFISINDVIRLTNSKYSTKGIKSFIKDGYLFIPFRKAPKAVMIEAFFEDPLEVFNFNTCTNNVSMCVSYLDMEWKCPSDLQTIVLQEVNKELFTFHHRLVTDENTDKNESIK
jgi:hypothetical protein